MLLDICLYVRFLTATALHFLEPRRIWYYEEHKTVLIVIVWNLTISNLDNLPAQATERKLTRFNILQFNPSPCTDLVACVTGVRKARERGFGALINMAKGARGKRRGPPSLPSSLLAHPPQFESYPSLSTSISCYYLRSTKSFRKTRGENVNNN